MTKDAISYTVATSMTPEEARAYAQRSQAAMYHKPPTRKRTGKTPEAKVKGSVDAYLKKIKAINIRTNAGSWQDNEGHWIMGAKAGTADHTVCLPNGVFCAIEDKAERGTLSDAQRTYLERVERLGGLAIVARSRDDVRAALVQRFGEAVVAGWEGK